jgi:hypothetical protein
VSEFKDLEKKAESYAGEHPEQAGKAVSEVAGFTERETDHQHDEQIDRAADAVEERVNHHGQDQPDDQSQL